MTETLNRIPDAGGLYFKAALTATRKPGADPQVPPLAVRVEQVAVDAAHLSEYGRVCGFDYVQQLPITFPHVMAGALHLHLMTQAGFPFPLLGLVHVRNLIEQSRPIEADERFDLQVRIGQARRVRQGIEFDLLTDAEVDGTAIWRETSTILHRMPAPRQQGARPAPEPGSMATYRSFAVPADTGRRYAAVGRDYNPIHLTPLTARLFGFPQHIAHGMWSAARCAAILQADLDHPPLHLSVQFRQPLLLPGRVTLKSVITDEGAGFTLMSARNSKPHLVGTLR